MDWDTYLILKVAGIVVFVFAGGLSVSKAFGISRAKAYFIQALAVLAGFALSRFWYMTQHYFGSDPYEVTSLLEAWEDAGSVLYGWVIGGTLTLVFLTRKFKLPTVRYLDCVLPWLLIAQALNRFGCLDAGCCFGRETVCPIAITAMDGVTKVHPVQAYEALFDLIWAWYLFKRPNIKGLRTFLYFTGYPIARFFFEFLRGDNKPALLFMTVPQVASLVILICIFKLRKSIFNPS